VTDAALREHLARSWPAGEVERRDGWLLRATPGLPRGRLNSALPLVVDPSLGVVERWYGERGLPAQVQVDPIGGHPRLEAELEARGWAVRSDALVMTGPAAPVAGRGAVVVLDAPTPAWLEAWEAAEGRDDVAAHASLVFPRLVGRAGFAVTAGGEAVGVAVAEGAWCALFGVAVRPECRRRGLGVEVVRALAGFGIERGARCVCLEVASANEAAVRLYRGLGFTRRYGYVHRRAAC
jgi:N-acetylglutamate synthase